ncbi:Cyclin-Y-like protein 1 [Phytophthora citrophthora]|uniref:Cyclin-Y-like protein 1 n=1 Tax=Phytophthora citrophthora TaxID=4793 RepID=A0AAD9LG19_9STRA|nr:Cyclin-Y-like protein 1 [Phytophthora citrophthora]
MNSVVSPLRMNMTTSGHPQAAPGPNQPQRRHHRSRGGSSSMDMAQDPRFAAMAAQAQMQGYMGYTPGMYPQQHQGMMKQNRVTSSSSSRHRGETRSNQVRQPRLHRSTTNEKRPEYFSARAMERDEDLAGRPAMIAMSQDDLPFDVLRERHSADRVESRSRHRSQRQPEEQRGNNKSAFTGNCRGGRQVNAGNSQSRGVSRGRSATTATEGNAASRGLSNQVPARTSAPGPRNQAPVRTSAPTRSSVPEPVAWRVAVDPKSKKPYYYHPITRETTWKKPEELVAAETREKRQFFSVMENNIRLKLRDGYYTRDSETPSSSQSTPDAVHKPHEMSPHLSTRSSASTVSCNSARSSFNSFTSGSARSLPGSARQMILNSTRSLPTTPEGMGVPYMRPSENQPQQEPESLERYSEDNQDGKKRPSLFRTLSSYETPVVTSSRKGSDGLDVDEVGRDASMCLAMPSPIQERVRLAALVPRASDLEAYARAVRAANGKGRPSLQAPMMGVATGRGSSASALMNTKNRELKSPATPTDKPRALRRRSNSTNSIYLRMGTMDAPDQDATIQCVATVLRAHMMEALEDPIRSDPRFDVFVTARDRQRLASISDELDAEASTFVEVEDDDVMLDVVPTLSEIASFVKHVFSRAQMESECIIMSLVYVERLLKNTSGCLQLRGENWRRLVFCSMVMASKVWDDLSMTNADFSKIWPELSLKQINELELVYLSAVEYNVRVSAVSYAKYYFHLRSMCATMGLLEAFDESAPLNLDGARKMQVLSEEYQERSKLMPVPRRRSVTITTTSAAESMQAGANAGRSAVGGAKSKVSKASPAASLEQLVHMQVRVAGGSSLGASMHRLSTNSTVKQ